MEQQAATMRMVLDEVFKSNFSVFDNYEEMARKEQILKLTYIEKIAAELEKNLTDVNLFDIFQNNNNIILADEGQINNALISFDREQYFGKPDEVLEAVLLTDEQSETIKNLYANRLTADKRRLQRDIDSRMESAVSRMRQYHDYIRQAKVYRERMELLQVEDSNPMVESITKVCEDPMFTLHRFCRTNTENDTIEFKINQDIINTHVNERANINLRVNLGRMKMRLTYANGIHIQVRPDRDNINARGYHHPHLGGSEGDVCLGNMGELYNEAIQKNDIHAAFGVIMQVLMNYNDGDPYRQLHHFATASQQVQPHGGRTERENRDQHHECYECGYEFRVTFEPEGVSDYTHAECPDCENESEYEFIYD